MSKSKTAHYASSLRVPFVAVSLGLMAAAGPVQSGAQGPGTVQSSSPLDSQRPSGSSTASQSSVMAGAQQQVIWSYRFERGTGDAGLLSRQHCGWQVYGDDDRSVAR